MSKNAYRQQMRVVVIARKTPMRKTSSEERLQYSQLAYPIFIHRSAEHMAILVVVLAVQDAQNGQEEVNNIQVQGDRSLDLVIEVVVAHNQLRVHEDIPREDKSSKDAVDELGSATERNEHGHESEQDHEPERAEEIRHPVGEVVLGLACEECQGHEYAQCQG